MPELPEVETTRRGLLPVMKGKRIAVATVRREDLRVPIPKGFAKKLSGTTVRNIRRRAKFLLLDLSSGDTVLIHLGMSGSLRTENPQDYTPRPHDHVVFTFSDKCCVVFHDPRRFGLIDLIPKGADEEKNKWLAHLGPEPLSRSFSAAYLEKALRSRKGPLKPTLMDQQLVVGVGNIYASESLFLARLDPMMPAKDAAAVAPVIVKSIATTLKKAIASGGSTLRDYISADGSSGYFQHRFNVYDRAGKPCFRCRTPITTATQSGRVTYYCSSCQKKGGAKKKH